MFGFQPESRKPLLRRAAIALSFALGVAGCAWMLFRPGTPPAAPAEAPPAQNTSVDEFAAEAISDSGPEPQLERIFADIEAMRLDVALKRTESLLQRYPNYRLAYLIKGDLLLARAHPLAAFGDAHNAPEEKIADLRAEAFVRLKGYRNRPPTDDVPRYLLQMNDSQQYAIVIDTRKSRLYLYQNDQGRPRFVADYYVSQGKLGADKRVEGDRRTPLGVYHITSHIPREKLADLYGHGAFPINYPNEWDKRQGRSGSGIWLHGTPSDTYSRPPQASDGCVVLSNPDFDTLGKNVQVGLTPVIISNDIEWLSLDDWNRERDELRRSIESWRADWESRDTERYLAHYSRNFKTQSQDFQRFAEQKRRVNQSKTWIKVRLEKISVFRNPGADELVVVTFNQSYASNNLNNSMQKRQYWLRENGQWKIVYEGNA
ncbi:MAG: L,D-transpeptidase family protein [Zoogloeaceae bacterium]|jgi:murein L,D-transpeptidase YafK|nr:L,D-transpeptidase family protein [Zoogloeaceae bacterium]